MILFGIYQRKDSGSIHITKTSPEWHQYRKLFGLCCSELLDTRRGANYEDTLTNESSVLAGLDDVDIQCETS